MSSDNRRISFRELRIHRGPVAGGGAPEPVAPVQRFARLMSGRAAPARTTAPVVREPSRELAAEAEASAAPADAEDDPLRAELSGRLAHAARAMRELRETHGTHAPAEPAEPEIAAATGAGAVLAAQRRHDRELAQYLAQTVTRFCNDPAVAHGPGWQVRLVLDPEILPDTTLELALSPLWLSLRFASGHARARHLVSSHQHLLQHLLETTLVPRREIAIHLD